MGCGFDGRRRVSDGEDDTRYRITPEGRKVVAEVMRRADEGEMIEDIAASYGVGVGSIQILLAMDALSADQGYIG